MQSNEAEAQSDFNTWPQNSDYELKIKIMNHNVDIMHKTCTCKVHSVDTSTKDGTFIHQKKKKKTSLAKAKNYEQNNFIFQKTLHEFHTVLEVYVLYLTAGNLSQCDHNLCFHSAVYLAHHTFVTNSAS